MKFFKFTLFLFVHFQVLAQLKPIGSWTDHLPYQSGTSIATDGNVIYCGTQTGVFSFNPSDGSISRFSKVSILNDVSVAKIGFNTSTNSLLVVYNNANIDIISSDQVTNLPFIKNNTKLSDKTINEILFVGNLAYLSFNFGVVVIDLSKQEIQDSFIFGSGGSEIKVNSTLVEGSTIWAATEDGLFKADLNNNLLDFRNWQQQNFQNNKEVSKLFSHGSLKYLIAPLDQSEDEVYSFQSGTFSLTSSLSGKKFKALYSNSNLTFITENEVQLFDQNLTPTGSFQKNNNNVVGTLLLGSSIFIVNTFDPLQRVNLDGSNLINIRPNGPFEKEVFDIKVQNGVLWAVGGGHDFSYGNSFKGGRIYKFSDNQWTSYLDYAIPSLNGLFDILAITIDPKNENNVYFATWGRGMVQFTNNLPFQRYDFTNSSLAERQAWAGWSGSGGGQFDEDGNFWFSNTFSVDFLGVRTNAGSWHNFTFTDYGLNDIGEETAMTEVVITEQGLKYIALPRRNEIVVFDDNGTINNISDDRIKLLDQQDGSGSIPGIRGITMALDQQNQLWLGTSDGIAVIFSPDNIFDPGSGNAERILIDDGENVEVLLEGTTITTIAVDGKNRKWIGTDGSGIYLLSADGKETIHHFKKENSPLLSNNIITVDIDQKSGEVYIGTSNGIVSYRGDAIEGKEDFSNVSVFPNPVRSGYNGPIAISGLMNNSTVKITDINGTLVNEIITQGGQAIWYGDNFGGEKVSTGVYLIFNSAQDEDEDLKTHIGKVLFVR